MTTSVPPSRGPSQALDVRAPLATREPTVLVPTERKGAPTTLTLPGVRRRGPKGEAIVVIANPPPYSQLIISFQQDRDRPGPHGVSVAVQAIPCFGELEDDDSATRVFDRQSVMPDAPSHTPAPQALPAPAASPAPVTAAPSLPAAATHDPQRDAARAAQDTYRFAASTATRDSGPIVSRWLLVPVACIVASACALLFVQGKDDVTLATPSASVVPKDPAPVAAPVAAVVTKAPAEALPIIRPESPRPSQDDDGRPSARIELRELGLDVTSTPWMEVLIDGKSVGSTPQRGIQLTPGEHDVELLNRDLGLETHAYVHAERGSMETQEIAFE